MKQSIKILLVYQFLVLLTYIISFDFYINLQIASLSSLFVILGSSYAYKKMVVTHVESKSILVQEKRDLLDEIEDPHGLYDDDPINNAPVEELDLKEIVKEERAKIKTLSITSIKKGVRGGVSLFRLVPYIFLVLGFIALKNNELLDISIYLPSLLVGIIVGSISSKNLS